MKITIKQIAEEAGVSMTTVSNVINQRENRVSKEKVALIQAIMKKHDYSPNMNARSLAKSSSSLIGVLYFTEDQIADFADPFIAEVVDGIEQEARNLGFFILLHNISSASDVEEVQKNWNFEGFVVIGITASRFKAIEESIAAPAVFIDAYTEEHQGENSNQFPRLFINSDDFGLAYAVTKYLIKKGHQKIAFLSYPFTELESVIGQRYLGYTFALKDHGISVTDKNCYTEFQLADLYRDKAHYSAVVCTADRLSAKLIYYVNSKEDWSIQDLSLISFDNIPYAKYFSPRLSTMDLNAVEKGRMAVQSIYKVVRKQEHLPKHLYINAVLKERDSVWEVD